MIIPDGLKKYENRPLDCPIYNRYNPDYRCSVDYDKTDYRKKKAFDESQKKSVHYTKVCQLIDRFLKSFDIESECIIIKGLDILLSINYEVIKRQYGLESQSDIVWLKFTKDGYLGVVASSNDVNFDKNNNSYKLISHVGKEWDENIVLIVPLPQIQNRDERIKIERIIGNYLIDNKVPIIDYYSHNL